MDERSERIARRFEVPVLVAAVLVVPVLFVEASPRVGEPWTTVAYWANWAIWLVFAAELATMLAVVPNRGRWLREHPLEVAIVVLTPPVLPASLQALRVLRLLRLLRLVQEARRVFSLSGLRYAALVVAVTALGGGAAFARLEPQTETWDGVWWAFTTITTVGYGDFIPSTPASRVLGVVVMLVGIAFVALLTGAVAERFLAPKVEQEDDAILAELRAIAARLEAVERALERRY